MYESRISNCTQTASPIMPGQYLKLYQDSTSNYTMTVPPITPREYLKLFQDHTPNYAMTLPQIRPLLLPSTSFPILYSIILLPFYATWCEPAVHKFWVQGQPGELCHMEAPNICESSVWNLLPVTFLAPINSEVAPRFLENLCPPLVLDTQSDVQ